MSKHIPQFPRICCKKQFQGENLEGVYRGTCGGHCQLHHRPQRHGAADGEKVWDFQVHSPQGRHGKIRRYQSFFSCPRQGGAGREQIGAPHPGRLGHQGEISAQAGHLQQGGRVKFEEPLAEWLFYCTRGRKRNVAAPAAMRRSPIPLDMYEVAETGYI